MRLELRSACFFLCLLALVGCPNPGGGPLVSGVVTITYRQVYNFNEWELWASDGSLIDKRSIDDGVYMRYRIVSISNRDTGAMTFHFDPRKLYASDPAEGPANPVIGLIGVGPIFDVAPGTIDTHVLNANIKARGNPAALRTQIQFLNYKSSAGEHVIMVNEDPHAFAVPYRNPLRIPGTDVN
jgi:hypothetical protein